MKILNFTTLLLIIFASLSLQANGPARPSTPPPVTPNRPNTPPITDQQLTILTAFFRVQTPEKIIESINTQNILGQDYNTQTIIISNYTQLYNELIKAVEETKIVLSTGSIPAANKKMAINNLKKEITRLYNLISQTR